MLYSPSAQLTGWEKITFTLHPDIVGVIRSIAKEENILQPAVSKQLGALEQGLGVRLLNRTTRRISLTEAGKEYYERCHRILDDIDELETQVTGL
ncbi:MAG: LysR family transcriptional regulator, partial [bacterium]